MVLSRRVCESSLGGRVGRGVGCVRGSSEGGKEEKAALAHIPSHSRETYLSQSGASASNHSERSPSLCCQC